MKRCPFCAEEIQDAAVKCRHCGSSLDAAVGAPIAPAGPAPAGAGAIVPAAGGAVAAVPIYEGAPSWRAKFWSFLGTGALIVAGLALVVALPVLHFAPWLTALIAGGSVVVVGLALLGYLTLILKTLQFRISTRTIDVESGLFSKRIETLQLWKVRDIEFEQSLLDRILNVCRIRVFTHDVTTPELLLWGLPESREMFDRLKNSIEIARQSRNVIGVVE